MSGREAFENTAERLKQVEAEVAALRARVEQLEDTAGERESRVVPPETAVPPLPETPPVEAPVASPVKPSTPPPLPVAVSAQPPPVPSPPPPVFQAPQPAGPSRMRQVLEAIHLAPPSEGSGEAQLGAWWATRIGALLAVIGVVFFGVYLSLDTSPWVKLVELAAVSVAMALAGVWFERKLPKFGSVLLGGGLALIYFTAFAAYAVPAVKVTDDLLVATVLQVGAVGLIYAVAARRGSATTATMATLLGFASALFSILEGFDDFAVYGALGLTLISVGLRRWKGWAAPLLVAAVLVHLVYLGVAAAIWDTETGGRSAWFVFAILGSNFGVILGSLFLEGPNPESGCFAAAQRWIQSLNTPLAVLAGFVVALIVLPDATMSWYFFVFGGVLVAAAACTRQVARNDSLFGVFGVKATALIALGVCTEWGERTRWIALAIEAFVVLAAAHRARSKALSAAAAAAWLVSLVFFMDDVPDLRGRLVSWSGLLMGLYVVTAPVFFTFLLRRWTLQRSRSLAVGEIMFGVIAAIPAVFAVGLFSPVSWGGLALLVISVVPGGVAYFSKSKVPVPAMLVALVGTHATVFLFAEGTHGLGWLWANASVIAITGMALGWRCSEIESPRRKGWGETWQLLGTIFYTAALSVVFSGSFQSMPGAPAIAVAMGAAAAVSWAGNVTNRTSLASSGSIVLAIAVFMATSYSSHGYLADGVQLWLWIAAAGGMAVFATLAHRGHVRDALVRTNWHSFLGLAAGIGCVVISWFAVHRNLDTASAIWALLAIATLYVGVAMVRQVVAGVAVGATLLLLLIFQLATEVRWNLVEMPWVAMTGAVAVGIAFAAIPAVAGRFRWGEIPSLAAWRTIHALVGTAFVMNIALVGRVPWTPVASVIWAVGGIAVFFVGLFLRSKPQRVIGLLALAVCIARVFLVDINSTLYRIAAFVVLGGVLLWIGFSYQRFKHFIDDDDEASEGPAAQAADEQASEQSNIR